MGFEGLEQPLAHTRAPKCRPDADVVQPGDPALRTRFELVEPGHSAAGLGDADPLSVFHEELSDAIRRDVREYL